jgi:hypothetical protein
MRNHERFATTPAQTSSTRLDVVFGSCMRFALMLGIIIMHAHPCRANLSITAVKTGKTILTVLDAAANLDQLFGLDLGGGEQDKMELTMSATATNVDIALVGGAILKDFDEVFRMTAQVQVPLPGGGTATANAWEVILAVNLDNGAINDGMSINGSIKHLVGPHAGDALQGPPLPFNLVVDADNATGGKVSATVASFMLAHPSIDHQDLFKGSSLTATVSSSLFVDDITGYTFSAGAMHVVPEPSTFILVATGLVTTAVSAWRRKKVVFTSDQSMDSTYLRPETR